MQQISGKKDRTGQDRPSCPVLSGPVHPWVLQNKLDYRDALETSHGMMKEWLGWTYERWTHLVKNLQADTKENSQTEKSSMTLHESDREETVHQSDREENMNIHLNQFDITSAFLQPDYFDTFLIHVDDFICFTSEM